MSPSNFVTRLGAWLCLAYTYQLQKEIDQTTFCLSKLERDWGLRARTLAPAPHCARALSLTKRDSAAWAFSGGARHSQSDETRTVCRHLFSGCSRGSLLPKCFICRVIVSFCACVCEKAFRFLRCLQFKCRRIHSLALFPSWGRPRFCFHPHFINSQRPVW